MRTILQLTIIELLLVASIFALWYFRRQRSIHAVIKQAAPVAAKTPYSNKRDASRWSFVNAWQVTPQQDDRQPLLTIRQPPGGYAPADRSTARRSHQRMYRQWSRERHD